MRRIVYILFVLIFPGIIFGQSKIEPNIDFVNQYIFRGARSTDGRVIQPSFKFSRSDATIEAWGNINHNKFSEVDYYFDYKVDKKRHSLSFGAVLYDYPRSDSLNTSEIYIKFELKNYFSLCLYKDVGAANGSYLDISSVDECSFPIFEPNQTLEIKMHFGIGTADHNEWYYKSRKFGLTDSYIQLSTKFVLDGWKVSPYIGYASLLSAIDSDNFPGKKATFIVGLSLGHPVSFSW